MRLSKHRAPRGGEPRHSHHSTTPGQNLHGAHAVCLGRYRGRGQHQKHRNNPMQSKLPMHTSRRCGASTRSGQACRAGAMPNGRCRMHGGLSPGPPLGNKNALKHGRYTPEASARRRDSAALLRRIQGLIE